MLKKRSADNMNAKFNSIIGEGVTMEGNITAKESLRVEGTIVGDVSSEGILVISASGKVTGNVKANDIRVAGAIEGDIESEGRIEVESSGRVMGNIKAKSLVIDQNAVFKGQCTMNMEFAVEQPIESL